MKINHKKLQHHDKRKNFPLWRIEDFSFQAAPLPDFRPAMGCPYPVAFMVDEWTFYCRPEEKEALRNRLVELGIIYYNQRI